MLFKQNIEPSCAYCRHSIALGNNEFACVKHGIMQGSCFCGLFRYEPTKRIPPDLPSIESLGLSVEDFEL